MQTMVSTATPHQTSARRCVMVRAMKSLMRMSERQFNTNPREDANAAAASGDPRIALVALRWRGELREPPWSRRALAPQSHGPMAGRLHLRRRRSSALQRHLRTQKRNTKVSLPLTYRSVF